VGGTREARGREFLGNPGKIDVRFDKLIDGDRSWRSKVQLLAAKEAFGQTKVQQNHKTSQ
jgi:hypothetical protein